MTTTHNSTRERILEAAEAVFADKGYHQTVVDDIGRATAMSKGGLYFHFPSKENLFFAVMDRLADRLVTKAQQAAAKAPTPLGAAEAALETVLASLSKRRRLARLLMIQGYSMGNAFEHKRTAMFSRFAGVIESHLDRAAAAGAIAPVDTQLAARVWLGAINEVVIHWLYQGGPPPVQNLPQIKRMLIGGLVNSKAEH